LLEILNTKVAKKREPDKKIIAFSSSERNFYAVTIEAYGKSLPLQKKQIHL